MTVFVLPPGICVCCVLGAVFTAFVGCTMTMFFGLVVCVWWGVGNGLLYVSVFCGVDNYCFCMSTPMLWWYIQWLFVWCLCFVG